MTVLKVEALKKYYQSPDGQRKLVLDIPDFTLNAGEQLALEGPSGSGKTTFLHIIAGILSPDEGRVTLADQVLTDLSEAARDRVRAEMLGYVFQTFNLLQGYSALENILLAMSFGKGGTTSEAEQLLKRVGLGDRVHYRPSQLSVGQQQRVALARALCMKPKLVLADEPTGNLDPKMAQQALNLLREICEENGAALLCVSHDEAILTKFDNRQSLKTVNKALELEEEQEEESQQRPEAAAQANTDQKGAEA